MSKDYSTVPSISEINAHIKKNKFLPIYFFFGEDIYQINQTIEELEKAISPNVDLDFDRSVFYGKASCDEVLDFAVSYPLGGKSKIAIFKEVDQRSEKEKSKLALYIKSPPPFTYLILSHTGKITSFSSEYLKALNEGDYIFESKLLKQNSLEDWLIETAAERGKTLSQDNARLLLDLSGDDRSILEMQLDKILLYIKDEKIISTEIIKAQSVDTKKYGIFDLEKAIDTNDRKLAFRVAFTLLDAGEYPLTIIGYFNKMFTNVSRVPELVQKQLSPFEAARNLGIPQWTYPKLVSLSRRYSIQMMRNIAEALLEADLAIKTSTLDHKTIVTKLLSVIFPV